MSKWSLADHIAFEDADGTRYGAVFDSERPGSAGYVRARVYGERWQTGEFWHTRMRFHLLTGERIDEAGKPLPGRLVEVPASLLDDFDLATGKPVMVTIPRFEYERLLAGGGAGPVASDPIERILVTVQRRSGAKDMIGGLAV